MNMVVDSTALTSLVYHGCPRRDLPSSSSNWSLGLLLPDNLWGLSSLMSDWSLECLDPDVRLDLSRLSSPCSG